MWSLGHWSTRVADSREGPSSSRNGPGNALVDQKYDPSVS